MEGLRKWRGRAKKRISRRSRNCRHGGDYNSPRRTLVDAGVDSPPSFRLETAPPPSVDSGGAQNDNAWSSSSAAVSIKGKGKRPLEFEIEEEPNDHNNHKVSSFDGFDWAAKIHPNFSIHAMWPWYKIKYYILWNEYNIKYYLFSYQCTLYASRRIKFGHLYSLYACTFYCDFLVNYIYTLLFIWFFSFQIWSLTCKDTNLISHSYLILICKLFLN